jgi:arylsulfatase A-like enzyme
VSRGEDAKQVLGYTRVLEPEPDAADEAYEHARTRADLASARAAARFVQAPREAPFFLSVGFWNAHRPFPDARAHGVNPDRARPASPVPETPEAREEAGGYRVLLGAVDRSVGMIMDALADAGRLEDTLVVLAVDHGPPFRGMKTTLYDTGTNVSLLLRFPEGDRAGEATDALVSQLDLFPTLCEYLGIEAPDWCVGRSLMPIARGETDEGHDAVFSAHHYAIPGLGAYDLKRAARTDRYKLIRLMPDPDGPSEPEAPSLEPFWSAAAGAEIPRTERRLHGVAHGELLFDLALDPMERVDIAGRPEYASVLEAMRRRLDDWLERTDDPALRGAVPAPPEG